MNRKCCLCRVAERSATAPLPKVSSAMEESALDPKQDIDNTFTPFAAPHEQKGAFAAAAPPEHDSAFAAAL